MPKRVKFVDSEAAERKAIEDPDGLQVLDECDLKWVEAWKAAVRNKTD